MAAAVTERTRVVIVCSPNNPTSVDRHRRPSSRRSWRAVPRHRARAARRGVHRVRDRPEAVDGIPLLDRYPNLVVLRTFSKAYGLAGLRVGYAVGPAYILDAARATAIPLSVTEPAQRAALASLDAEDELLDAGRAAHRAPRPRPGRASSSRAGHCRSRTATSSGCRRAATRRSPRELLEDARHRRAGVRARGHPGDRSARRSLWKHSSRAAAEVVSTLSTGRRIRRG